MCVVCVVWCVRCVWCVVCGVCVVCVWFVCGVWCVCHTYFLFIPKFRGGGISVFFRPQIPGLGFFPALFFERADSAPRPFL